MKIEVIASGSKGNCYKISNEETTLLIECGISYKEIQKALNFNVSDVYGCLITHEHMDHSKAYKDLIKAGVNLYMSEGTKDALKLSGHRVKTFKKHEEEYRNFLAGSFIVRPFSVVHDAREPVGFYILDVNTKEALLFITDTKYSKYKFEFDYLMIEINYVKENINENKNLNEVLRKRIKENHMSLETAIDFLNKCNLKKLKKIYVLHLSERNSDAKIIKESLQELTGASVEIC